jgi:riboflavin kinase/FMN adenylyltransferase
MNVWNGTDRYPSGRGKVVASIGNYDGVHIGHQSILAGVIAEARAKGLASLLITFDPHPLTVVAPTRAPHLLQTRKQKLASLAATGLDGVLVLEFDEEVAALEGEDFFHEVLDGQVRFETIHVGDSFRFGAGRSGDRSTLEAIGATRGFAVNPAEPVRLNGEIVSSSAIRRIVAEGQVERARRMLGRPFAVEGEVMRGDGRGRGLQFPTANLDVENSILPRDGVYVTESVIDGTRYPSVSNVGTRPTFRGTDQTVESHLIEFDGDLYDRRLEVRFLARIRDELAFDSPTELADQIARDRAAAESYFQNLLIKPGR